MANDTTGVGRHLRMLREQAGLTQTEAALRAGLTREAVCAIDNGRHDPRMSTIRRYCDAIGARVYIGLGGDG
ncbi:helix-turn-helix domain-containing protein [Amycolatopsis mongoliensis]|uniref:Helix-turn-helix domain-containing protein n=1 Tax=Amycolatopsis mongoliensis TaxID=715475 RepID=A0A9Y2JXI9_9PSEU|nr:helix-turn-helix domain-containing protein [Amycolatopsis sp. 4-36]WIY05451.1 helix-turn-helix domain-containing protein [Amycolatopsis sp. 4-36]